MTALAILATGADERPRCLLALRLNLGWEDARVPRALYFAVVGQLERAGRLPAVLGLPSAVRP